MDFICLPTLGDPLLCNKFTADKYSTKCVSSESIRSQGGRRTHERAHERMKGV